jgi:Ca2+-binding RTX toxin-like protein
LPSNVENLVFESTTAQAGKGNSANNIITAGTGADTMTGNGGHDMFVFGSAADHADVITDFKSGDLLDLRPLMQAIGYTGTDPVADQVLQFTKSGSDTTISLHTATDTHTLVTLQHIVPTSLHAGTDYVWH